MKKKILILVCMMSLITTVGAFAALHISEEVKFNKMSKFDQMVAVMDESITDDEIFNYVLINYKYLQDGIKVSSQNMTYLSNLIIDGYTAEDIINCAYFWLDTSEEVTIVKELCDWKTKNKEYGNNQFWFEDAYNAVTSNKCGVLTMEDFEEYGRRGITDDKILIANRLCRKGVYTIQEILEKYENGISMADIALEIEETTPWTKHTDVASVFVNSDTEYPKAEDTEIFQSKELAALKNSPDQAFYDVTDKTTDIQAEFEEVTDIIMREITAELRAGNYMRIPRKDVAKND